MEGIPPPLLHNLKHNKILYERIVFPTVVTDEVPRPKEKERTRVQFLGPCFWREHVFAWMARSEGRATAFFNIPPGRVVELGLQVEL